MLVVHHGVVRKCENITLRIFKVTVCWRLFHSHASLTALVWDVSHFEAVRGYGLMRNRRRSLSLGGELNMATVESDEPTFVETALKLGGKSDEEARTTGAVDRAEDQVEAMYLAAQRTSGGPVHRAVWDDTFPSELFATKRIAAGDEVRQVMDRSLEVVRRRKQST